ncbi:putative methionyl-tRNA synthetase [Hordeum vulgare]|nr:putative methionyl-tRNA synthetase [Hordeum vulgare]
MDASLLPPVTVEVAHAPPPQADLVADHVGPAVTQASAAPARKLQGNVVMPGGNPTAPAAKLALRALTLLCDLGRRRRRSPRPRASRGRGFRLLLHPLTPSRKEMPRGCRSTVSLPSQISKNYMILEDQALIQAWSAVSLDVCTGTSQTPKRYWQRIEDKYFRIMAKYPNRTPCTFRSLEGRWENIKPMCGRLAACLEQVRNALSSGTVESDYDKIAQHRYKDMEASEGKFFKLEHCWELLQKCEKWKLINKESLLLAEKNKIMSMNRDDMDDLTNTWHDMARREILKRSGLLCSIWWQCR